MLAPSRIHSWQVALLKYFKNPNFKSFFQPCPGYQQQLTWPCCLSAIIQSCLMEHTVSGQDFLLEGAMEQEYCQHSSQSTDICHKAVITTLFHPLKASCQDFIMESINWDKFWSMYLWQRKSSHSVHCIYSQEPSMPSSPGKNSSHPCSLQSCPMFFLTTN